MNAFPLLSLFAFLLLLLLLPILFGELMATSLVKLHLSPEAALRSPRTSPAGCVGWWFQPG
jgi:hypothetical protein